MLNEDIEITSRHHKPRLLDGSVAGVLTRLTFPMMVSSISLVAFNLTDTFFVGKLGARELAAMTFTFPVVLFFASISLGLGMGTAAVISRSIGEGDHQKMLRLTTDSLILSLILSVICLILGFLGSDLVFKLIGAEGNVLGFIKEYMTIWYGGLVFMFISMAASNAIRATGDIKTPGIILMAAVILNIILDPVFIFGSRFFPGLKIAGASLATVICEAFIFIMGLFILWRRKMIDLNPPKINNILHSWKQILYIGIPSAATNVIVPISMGIITGLVAKYGPEAVAAFGVGGRVESLLMLVIMALSASLVPFIGQNWGANQLDRVKQALKYSHKFSMIWGISMFIIMAIFAKPVAFIFNKDPRVVTSIIRYLWIIPIGNGFQGIFLTTNASLNALNKPLDSAILTVIRMFFLYIPLAYLGSLIMGLNGVFGGLGLANILIGIISYLWIEKTCLSLDRNHSLLTSL